MPRDIQHVDPCLGKSRAQRAERGACGEGDPQPRGAGGRAHGARATDPSRPDGLRGRALAASRTSRARTALSSVRERAPDGLERVPDPIQSEAVHCGALVPVTGRHQISRQRSWCPSRSPYGNQISGSVGPRIPTVGTRRAGPA